MRMDIGTGHEGWDTGDSTTVAANAACSIAFDAETIEIRYEGSRALTSTRQGEQGRGTEGGHRGVWKHAEICGEMWRRGMYRHEIVWE